MISKPSWSEFLMISKEQSFSKRSEASFNAPSTFPATVALRRPLPMSAATSSIEIDESKDNTEQIIKYITNNKDKFYNYLIEDDALLNMIYDMIQNKEYEKFTNTSEPEPESEPESEPGVPEEYFKLETGGIVYSITTPTGVKLFNNVNDNYTGEKIGDYLESSEQAKVKLVSCEKPKYKTLKEAREALGVSSLGEKEENENENEEEDENENEEEDKEEDKEDEDSEDESEEEEEIDMTKIKKMQYKKKDYFRIKDQDPAFIYENNSGLIGKKIGKIIMVGSKKKVEFF